MIILILFLEKKACTIRWFQQKWSFVYHNKVENVT